MKSRKSMYPAVLKLCAAAVLGLGAGAAFAGAPAGAASAASAQAAGVSDQTDRLIVKYKDEAGPGAKSTAKGLTRAAASSPMAASRKAMVDQVGRKRGLTMKELHTIGTGARVIQMNRKLAVAEAAKLAADLMASDSSVEYAEPDRIMKPMFTPNDPLFAQQWDYTDVTGGMRLPAEIGRAHV